MDSKTNKELNNEYKDYPYKLITNIEIEKEGFDWYMKDNLPKSLPDGVYILNTGSVKSGGEHWQVFALKFPNIYFCGSYGATSKYKDRPQYNLINFGKRNGFDNIYCYEHQLQIADSVACGEFALYIGNLLKKNFNKLSEGYFDNMINHEFDKKPSAYNINKVVEWARREGLL